MVRYGILAAGRLSRPAEYGMEMFEIVDENDRVIGVMPRAQCHGNPTLVHRVAHVLVVNDRGEILLQKRSQSKDIQPGKWDTSVGGHLDPGEDYLVAATREMAEELGLRDLPLTFLYYSRIRNEIESENVATYLASYGGEVFPNPREIDQVRFWSGSEIEAALGTGVLTPNFEQEWQAYRNWCR
ncbi:MAG: NUDIX hydrolase [Trichloromonadaceae bacterium]